MQQPNTANNVDTESLKLLIQQLPQSRIRTAARRLGIADKVDGHYQRLAILRSQLQANLLCQPMRSSGGFESIESTIASPRCSRDAIAFCIFFVATTFV